MWDFHIKDRRSQDRLIFNMGISILVRQHPYIEYFYLWTLTYGHIVLDYYHYLKYGNNWGLMTPYGIMELGHHWFRRWLAASSTQSPSLNQCLYGVNLNRWHLYKNWILEEMPLKMGSEKCQQFLSMFKQQNRINKTNNILNITYKYVEQSECSQSPQ